jgi:hypothetical protein
MSSFSGCAKQLFPIIFQVVARARLLVEVTLFQKGVEDWQKKKEEGVDENVAYSPREGGG